MHLFVTLLGLFLAGVTCMPTIPYYLTGEEIPNTPENLFKLQNLSETDLAEELSGQYEGDMIISQERLENYNGKFDVNYHWIDHKVPFWINMTFYKESHANYIKKAMKEIEAVTCLKFIDRTNEKDFIHVTGDTTGCSSNVGRIGGAQTVKLAPNSDEKGCFRLFTIAHEFIHALGFYHMQSASERDQYVRIAWENIETGKEHNFEMRGSDKISLFSVPYDYGSVMHYSKSSFSFNGKPTIVPLQDLNALGVTMGQRLKLSDKDILRINRMYSCTLSPRK